MTTEEKNKYIEEYTRNLSKNINSQYKTPLIDEDKILRVVKMYKDSDRDLEKEIIPEIDKLAEQLLKDFLEFQERLGEMMKNAPEEPMQETATLDLGTEKNGLYLNQQQIDLLMITEIETPEELSKFVEECAQFPNQTINDIIPDYGTMGLEEAKRKLYQIYQDNLIGYLEKDQMSFGDLAKFKLEKMGVQGPEINKCLELVSQGSIKDVYSYLGQNYGNDFITNLNRYMIDDFENVKPVSYEEMESLSKLIKNDDSINTICIATGNFGNTVFQGMDGMTFDPYLVNRGADYCAKHDKHMRYHSLFDYMHLENIIASKIDLNGRLIDELKPEEIALLRSDKQEVLGNLKQFVALSMANISAINAKYPELIKQVEIFNELVERNKKDKNSLYEMVWEKYFGITVDDILGCFPRDENGNIVKPNGVEFVYNETLLTESPEKRKAVEKTLYQIEKRAPGIIDVFGDQMHTSSDDVMTAKGIKNLNETAQMVKRIQDGRLIVDGELKIISPKKTECTEHDHHFTKDFLDNTKKLTQSGWKINLWNIKLEQQRIISEIYNNNGVRFEKSTFWALFCQTDHNEVRENKHLGRKVVETMYAGLVPDGKKLPSLLNYGKKVSKQNSDKTVRNLKLSNNQNKAPGFVSTLIISIITIIAGLLIITILYNLHK